MTALASNQPSKTNAWLYPVIADVIGIGLFFLLNSFLTERFGRNASDYTALIDAAILGGIYVLFLFGVQEIRRLSGELPPIFANRNVIGGLCVLFATGLAFAIADLAGYLDNMFTVDFGDIGNGYYFLITPAMYFFFSMLYFFVLIQPVRVERTHGVATLVGLVAINALAVAVAIYVGVVLSPLSGFVAGVLGLLILAVMFLLPRAMYYFKTGQMLSLISADIFLIVLTILIVMIP